MLAKSPFGLGCQSQTCMVMRFGCQKPNVSSGAGCGRGAAGPGRGGDERPVGVVAAGTERSVAGAGKRRPRGLAREDPLDGGEPPASAPVLVDEDGRLADVEALEGRIHEVIAHVGIIWVMI